MFCICAICPGEDRRLYVKSAKSGHCIMSYWADSALHFATRDQAADVADEIETYRHDLALSIEEV